MQKKQSPKTRSVRSIGADQLEEVHGGGFVDSGPSDANRIIERHELDGNQGAYLISIPRDTP